MKSKKNNRWTQEERDYLKEITPGNTYSVIVSLMKERFNKEYSKGQCSYQNFRMGISNGINQGQFKKGHTPWCKGTKGIAKSKKTSFKKGNVPKNTLPIGSERTNYNGYILIKTRTSPGKWEYKHHLEWEKHNGKVPKGYSLIFLDGDKTNTDISNLKMVSSRENLIINKNNLRFNDKDLTETGVNLAKLIAKTEVIRRNKNEKK